MHIEASTLSDHHVRLFHDWDSEASDTYITMPLAELRRAAAYTHYTPTAVHGGAQGTLHGYATCAGLLIWKSFVPRTKLQQALKAFQDMDRPTPQPGQLWESESGVRRCVFEVCGNHVRYIVVGPEGTIGRAHLRIFCNPTYMYKQITC